MGQGPAALEMARRPPLASRRRWVAADLGVRDHAAQHRGSTGYLVPPPQHPQPMGRQLLAFRQIRQPQWSRELFVGSVLIGAVLAIGGEPLIGACVPAVLKIAASAAYTHSHFDLAHSS